MISSAVSVPSAVPGDGDDLSYSALNLSRQSPLRYKFLYLDGLPEGLVSSSLVFGSAVHRAAELHFQAQGAEPLPTLRSGEVGRHVHLEVGAFLSASVKLSSGNWFPL